jgi:hypothetical protein
MAPLLVHELVVAMDYGQFGLTGRWHEGDPMMLLEEALAGENIASDGFSIVVCSPHQNNFQMPLRIEVWSHEPPDDGEEWEEIFDSRLTVDGGAVHYDSPTMQGASCDVPDGEYAVRICGRGFVNRGWPGSTTPGDSWRVQLWPSHSCPADRRVKTWNPPHPPDVRQRP